MQLPSPIMYQHKKKSNLPLYKLFLGARGEESREGGSCHVVDQAVSGEVCVVEAMASEGCRLPETS
jgi:hypothetical protein